MHAVLGSYTLIGTSVLAMAVVMLVRDDPDASVGLAGGFGVLTGVRCGCCPRRCTDRCSARTPQPFRPRTRRRLPG